MSYQFLEILIFLNLSLWVIWKEPHLRWVLGSVYQTPIHQYSEYYSVGRLSTFIPLKLISFSADNASKIQYESLSTLPNLRDSISRHPLYFSWFFLFTKHYLGRARKQSNVSAFYRRDAKNWSVINEKLYRVINRLNRCRLTVGRFYFNTFFLTVSIRNRSKTKKTKMFL